MKTKTKKTRRGFSIVEVVVASAALLVMVVGSSAYRYLSSLDERRALMQSTASRIGLFLCEAWRGGNGNSAFNPTVYVGADMTIEYGTGPAKSADFTLLGSYTVTLDNVPYAVTMAWKNENTGLRALNVIIGWSLSDAAPQHIISMTSYVAY